MGFKILFLTTLLILAWITGPSFYRARTGCIQCHPTFHQKNLSKFLIKQCRYEKSGKCVKCHRGNPLSNRKNIAHSNLIPGRFALFTIPENPIVKIGYELIREMGCRRCHQINHKGNVLASNLDLSYKTTCPEILFHAIQNPSVFMPKFYFSQKNIKILVNTILAFGANNDFQLKNAFETVHFEIKNHKTDKTNIFNIHCGSCHRILTKEYGPLGKGDIGPNISGLFSNIQIEVKGKSSKGKVWNCNKLKLWLNNPRNIRPATEMQPVKLNNMEFTGILNILDKDHCMQ